ncbi:MAG: hypothetical protein IRZ07_03485 [Microbispora sp.]|nr:hypothetical protein [Microbispora sp.]
MADDKTTMPEANEDRIDPRLDNRTGADRPPLEDFPATPQQVNGPELGDPVDRDAVAARVKDDQPRKGMKSTGPHGLGDTSADRA